MLGALTALDRSAGNGRLPETLEWDEASDEAVKVLLDTHVWLWWLLGSERLQPQERRSLDRLAASGSSHIAAMNLWEAQGGYLPPSVPAGVQVGARFFLHRLASFSCIGSSIFAAFESRHLLH